MQKYICVSFKLSIWAIITTKHNKNTSKSKLLNLPLKLLLNQQQLSQQQFGRARILYTLPSYPFVPGYA